MGPEDIIASVGIELNNIESSIAQANSLASEIGEWSKNTEAWGKSIDDVNTILSRTTEEIEKQVEQQQILVSGAEQLRDIGAVSAQNAKNMADYYRDLNGVLSNMSGNLNIVGALGATAGFGGGGGGGGSGNGGPPMMLGAPSVDEEQGMPSSASGGTSGAGGNLFQAVMMGMTGKTSRPSAGQGKGNTPMTEEEAIAAAKSSRVHNMMNIPYYLPGGKASLALRYADRLMGGKLSQKMAEKPWITGHGNMDAAQKEFERLGGVGKYLDAKNMTAAELESAGIGAEAVAAGDAAILSGGALGLVSKASPYLAAGYAAYKVYQGIATYQQQGQLLGSLTGETNSAKMLGYESGDFYASFMNPRLSYGAAKDITMTGLGAGFQGSGGFGSTGTGLLGQYTNFASGAYQNYGMSSQDSMQLFQEGVIKAGASAQDLTNSLQALAAVSATTNTSFAALKANFNQFLGSLSGLGASSSSATALATANALTNSGNPLLQGAGSTASILGTTTGQALAANTMGISYTQMYNTLSKPGGAQQVAAASNAAVLNILKNMGLSPGMPNLREAVGSLAYALPTILTDLGVTNKDSSGKDIPWDQKTAVEWTITALSNGGSGEASSQGDVKSVTGLINNLTNGKSGTNGLHDMFWKLNHYEQGRQANNKTIGNDAYTAYQVKLHGKTQTLSGDQILHLSQADQSTVFSELTAGTATVGMVSRQNGTRVGFNKNNTVASLTGNKTLQGMNDGSITQVELGPGAAALFTLVKNPQRLTNQQIKYLAAHGLNLNTGQGSGWGW